jgi:alpha-tubulin suppressor-like RCC1 family protein
MMGMPCRIGGAALVLVFSTGCGSDGADPTEPLSPTPTPITASSAALSFRQLIAGEGQTCGVTMSDQAYCWGANNDAQLGDGTREDRRAPVAVRGGLQFRNVTAGGLHSCGVATNDKAYCWGGNYLGGLGDGTEDNHETPTAVVGGLQFRSVTSADFHTCGVTTDDRAYCWGSNFAGQVGDGTTTDRLTPVPVAGGFRFRQLAAGRFHTCGITTSDRAVCWGANDFGQVGDSSMVVVRLAPVRVAGGRYYRQIDGGAFHTCAVTLDNKAFCWGQGQYGQLGNGKSFLKSFWPRRVSGGVGLTRISAGENHTCGVTADGSAYCWGDNYYGQLGDRTNTRRLVPTRVTGGLLFAQVSAGNGHTCGRTSAGAGFCWGANDIGQLGDGSLTWRRVPTPVAGPQ